jgi:pimeloyl-ACP methyl ester carboxylesterase
MLDQIAVLDRFNAVVGHPARTIAWGDSMGGLISAGLIQRYPEHFSGAVTLSGIVAGIVGTFNEVLDRTFALNMLLASGQLEVVHITHLKKDVKLATKALVEAQATPQGRARIDLVAALMDLPGWNELSAPNPPQPGPHDYLSREKYNYSTLQFTTGFWYGARESYESLAGGNPSWNTAVDYRRQLQRSVDFADVKALYERAGISLDADLDMLNKQPGIEPDPPALSYAIKNIVYNGRITVPVLTLHTIGDEFANVQHVQAYAAAVGEARGSDLLRDLFVHRAGHVNFTSAEVIIGLEALVRRLDTGAWRNIEPRQLNAAALDLGPRFNRLLPPTRVSASAAFIKYQPAPFPRPFDRGG